MSMVVMWYMRLKEFPAGFQIREKKAAKLGGAGLRVSTEGPSWGHPMPVLGALCPFLEPFCGQLSPKK